MSKLATFRLEEELWEAFLTATKEESASASSVLLEFVKWYVAGNRLPKQKPEPEPSSSNVQQMIDERIALLQMKLEERISGVEHRLGELVA